VHWYPSRDIKPVLFDEPGSPSSTTGTPA
jgi:hypothetical protein